MSEEVNKIVLAYSGGLDTSVILKWLVETYGAEVICLTADLGQGEELEEAREKALKTGASKVYVEDLQEEFVKEFVFPAIKFNAVYEGQYLLGTSVARPLIAKRMVEIARNEDADALAHGCTGKGNDQLRFELTFAALAPDLRVIAPWREWDLKSRTALIEYAKERGIPVSSTAEKPYSIDRNLLHASFEGGLLEDPWNEPPGDMLALSVAPEDALDKSTYIELEFNDGEPVALDGKVLSPAGLLVELNKLGGENGIGRVDIVEDRVTGMKIRGVCETPGGTIMHAAHRAMESITMDREVMHLRDSLMPKYARLIYNGFWYSPEMELLRSFMDETQKNVTGTVRLKLYKGNCIVCGRKSPYSLYSGSHATFEEDTVYNHKDAEGFIQLNALRLKVRKLLSQDW